MTRSKPASKTSREGGDAPESGGPGTPRANARDGHDLQEERAERAERAVRPAAPSARKDGDKPRAIAGPTEIALEVSRQRSMAWTIIGLVVGGLLIAKLGTVGVWGGFALVAMGVFHAWSLARSLIYPAGTIVVSDRLVSLPRGLCVPRPVQVKPQDITAAYLLRRSVPWNHAAPVLIIEIGPRAMTFPRDWFASEADQRHVIHHLRALSSSSGDDAGLPRDASTEAPTPAAAADDKPA